MSKKQWEKKPLKAPLYERQQGESPQAFEAFAIYRDTVGKRSTQKVAVQLTKSEALLRRWSTVWGWVDRVAAWDAEADDRVREAIIKQRAEMTKRHVQQFQAMQFKAIERLATLDPSELKPGDLSDFLIQAAKMERLAVGEPTERTEQSGTLKHEDVTPESRRNQLSELLASLRDRAGTPGTPAPAPQQNGDGHGKPV